jgi:hypothetical protein
MLCNRHSPEPSLEAIMAVLHSCLHFWDFEISKSEVYPLWLEKKLSFMTAGWLSRWTAFFYKHIIVAVEYI